MLKKVHNPVADEICFFLQQYLMDFLFFANFYARLFVYLFQ